MPATERFCLPLPDDLSALAGELADVFISAGFDVAGIAGFLGPEATEALHRGEYAPVALRCRDDSQMAWLVRIFLLHDAVPATALAQAVGARLATQLVDTGIVRADEHGTVYCALEIRPQIIAGRERVVFSDVDASLIDHVPGSQHVVGVGAASLSLLQSTPLSPVGTVLDLGTGSGVQVLGQLGCAESVTATDVSERALTLARATVAAAGASDRVELKEGSWFEPVAGRRFDRVVANPPFVVGLPEVGHVYRDSGMELDGASQKVVSEVTDYLNPGGTAHLLAAWVHRTDENWAQRVASWLPSHGVAAWVIERDVADPALYVSTWLRDESVDVRTRTGRKRSKAWLEYLAAHDVTGIGFGFVALQRIADDAPTEVLAESLPQAFSDPLGPEVEEYFARVAWLRDLVPGEIETKYFGLRPGVALEDVSVADAESHQGFEPAVKRLTRTEGPRWSHEVDDALAAVVAGLRPDGLNLGETIALYAAAHGLDEEELVRSAVPAIVDLIRHGLVLPADFLD